MASKKRYAFTAKITRLKRLNNSTNGNPRYEVGFDNGQTLITSSNHSFVYGINNPEMKGNLEVFVSAANRIVDLQPVSDVGIPSQSEARQNGQEAKPTTALDAYNLLADLCATQTRRPITLFEGLVELTQKMYNLGHHDAVTYVSEELQEIAASKG